MSRKADWEAKAEFSQAFRAMKMAVGLTKQDISELTGISRHTLDNMSADGMEVGRQSRELVARVVFDCSSEEAFFEKAATLKKRIQQQQEETDTAADKYLKTLPLEDRYQYHLKIAGELGCDSAIRALRKKWDNHISGNGPHDARTLFGYEKQRITRQERSIDGHAIDTVWKVIDTIIDTRKNINYGTISEAINTSKKPEDPEVNARLISRARTRGASEIPRRIAKALGFENITEMVKRAGEFGCSEAAKPDMSNHRHAVRHVTLGEAVGKPLYTDRQIEEMGLPVWVTQVLKSSRGGDWRPEQETVTTPQGSKWARTIVADIKTGRGRGEG